MKISENNLRKIICESIISHLNESAADLDFYNDSFEDIISQANTVAYQYERYADQIRTGIQYTEKIYQEIIQEVSREFNTDVQVQYCSLSDGELEIVFSIPVQNFLIACKNNERVIEDLDSEERSDNDFIQCGLYSDWDDVLAYVGDRQHNVIFRPEKINGNTVTCNVTVSNAIITWD